MSDRESLGFSYRETKDKRIFLYWENRQIAILSGARAAKFLERAERLDESGKQLLMARVTGNFKRGNERQMKRSSKN